MTHTAESLAAPTARTARPGIRGNRAWVILLLAAAVFGFASIETGSTRDFLTGLNLETGSIPGEDWHGNVRRSSTTY